MGTRADCGATPRTTAAELPLARDLDRPPPARVGRRGKTLERQQKKCIDSQNDTKISSGAAVRIFLTQRHSRNDVIASRRFGREDRSACTRLKHKLHRVERFSFG